MNIDTLATLLGTLRNHYDRVILLHFWKDHPQLLSLTTNVQYEFDDAGDYHPSRVLTDITFTSEDARHDFLTAFLRSLHVPEEDIDERFHSFKLDAHLDGIDCYLQFTDCIVRGDSGTIYCRPEGTLDEMTADLMEQIREALLGALQGESVYAVLTPYLYYDDERYTIFGERELSSLYLRRADAADRCEEMNRDTVTWLPAEDAEPDYPRNDGWWGERNPGDCEDIGEKLSIWKEHRPEYLAFVEEVPLQ